MLNANGIAEFCPGCSASSDYLGELPDPSAGGILPVNFVEGISDEDTAYFVLRDDEGGETKKVSCSMDTIEAVQGTPPSKERMAAIYKRVDEIVYGRVGTCKAGTVCKADSCPALSSTMFEKIVKVALEAEDNGR